MTGLRPRFNIKNEDSEIYKQSVEADEFNKIQPSFTKLSINTKLIYNTHPQAVYTSRLLKFNNLPEPKKMMNIQNL
ncbi:hypothetical protein C1645_839236 [Glomus cerebriforme]|uniref:Uncharacterized protein n=1 Tax=Glomus cerebriforme TaxID=658196 RepID=A0A397S721_9GLOM|nr:hypothetical protein C1645_839236 [Glomus cerebriforme]